MTINCVWGHNGKDTFCDGDAFGGASHLLGGKIQKELPIFQDGLLYVTI